MNKNIKCTIGILLLAATVISFGLTGCRSERSTGSESRSSKREETVEDYNILCFSVAPMIGNSKTSFTVNTNGKVRISAPDYSEEAAESGSENTEYTTKLSSSDLNDIIEFVDKNSEDNDFANYMTDGGDYRFEITAFDSDGKECDIFTGYQSGCEEINDLYEILSGYLMK